MDSGWDKIAGYFAWISWCCIDRAAFGVTNSPVSHKKDAALHFTAAIATFRKNKTKKTVVKWPFFTLLRIIHEMSSSISHRAESGKTFFLSLVVYLSLWISQNVRQYFLTLPTSPFFTYLAVHVKLFCNVAYRWKIDDRPQMASGAIVWTHLTYRIFSFVRIYTSHNSVMFLINWI